MKIELKLYNFDVVDCSTGFVNIIPDESNLRVLLDMILKIVDSDFIHAIGNFDIQFQGNVGSLITIQSPYITEEWGFNRDFHISRGIEGKNIIRQDSEESKKNKSYDLYVENLESAISRKSNDKDTNVVQSGLRGIKEAIQIIYTILDNQGDHYPSIIPHDLDTIIFLSLSIDIGFVEGALYMTRILLDSRRNLISIIFNSDGLPLPEEEYDKPVFSFIGTHLTSILKESWPELFELNYVWGDDELHYVKGELQIIDTKHKLNSDAFFYDSWYLPDFKILINYDKESDIVVAIYHSLEVRNELWVILKDLNIKPRIDTFGVHFLSLEELDLGKIRKKDLLYGVHIRKGNLQALEEEFKVIFKEVRQLKGVEKFFPYGFHPFLQFSSDGKFLFTTATESTIKVLDTEDWTIKRVITNSSNPQDDIVSFIILNNDQFLITCSFEEPLKLWDINSGEIIRQYFHEDILVEMLISHDNKYIIAGGEGEIIYIWEVSSGDLVLEIRTETIRSIALSPNDRYIIGTNREQEIIMYNFEDGKELKKFMGHTSEVPYLAFTSDSERIISVSNDNTIKIWSIETGKILKEFDIYRLKQDQDYIISALLFPDDNYICVPLNTCLKIWDITNEIVHEIPFDVEYITGNVSFSIALSHDGSFLAMSDGSLIYVWKKHS